ncbi:MAG: HD domain-containing protein [Chloroflexota bacterium]
MDQERAECLLSFLETVDRLKSVYRATYLTGEDRHENDAEHMSHMALFAMLFSVETGMALNMSRVYELILVHDLPEVIAGDTWAYDAQGRLDAHEREARAAEDLFAPLPEDVRARLHCAWREFEDGETLEARFVHAMDRLQGASQNVFSRGRSWRQRGVSEHMVRERNAVIGETDPTLATVLDTLLQRAVALRLWTEEPAAGFRRPGDTPTSTSV